MDFHKLINRCLEELGFRTEANFSDLVKSDHNRLKSLLNAVNKDICSAEDWDFRVKSTSLNLTKDLIEHNLGFNGRILKIFVDKVELQFDRNFTKFYTENASGNSWGVFGDKLLVKPFAEDKTATVYYFRENFALASDSTEKTEMALEDDSSIIPSLYSDDLLIYGACLRFKANTAHPKYKSWLSNYIQAYKSLKSLSHKAQAENPRVVLKRQ